MSLQFPSQEWADALKSEINQSASYAKAAAKWEGDFNFVVEESGDVIYMDLWHGECREALYFAGSSEKQPAFQITAKTDNWQKVLTGKLDPVQGMMTRQLKLDGNMVKIMANVKAAQELVRCATKVDTAF